MGPRTRDWVGAAVLALVLVVLIVLLVAAATGAPKSAEAFASLVG